MLHLVLAQQTAATTVDVGAVVAILIALAPVVYWLVDLVTDIKNGDVNGSVTKLVAVLVSFGILSLYAHSGLSIGDTGPFVASLNWCALLLSCLVFAATGGVLKDVVRAVNRSDGSVKSTLLKIAPTSIANKQAA